MATPSQILNARYINEEYVPKRVSDVFDTTKSLTGELYGGDVLRNLERTGGVPVFLQDADVEPEPNVPTLDVILTRLGVKEDNDPTGEKAARKFVEQFTDPKKHSVWKDKVMKDPAWGKRGWDTIVEAFKRTSNDLMNADIQKARYDAVHDGTARGFLANLMFPRVVKAAEEGRDPGASEWARDIAANAAYSVPVGRIAGSVTKAAPAAVRVLAGSGSQFAAPTVVAATDLAMDPNYDWGDFKTDVKVGGLTNLGVNKMLAPAIGRATGAALGKVSSRVPPSVKAVLEGASTPRELADEKVRQAERTLATSKLPFRSSNFVNGVSTAMSADDIATAQGIKEIAEAAGKTLDVGKGKNLKPSEILKSVENAAGDRLKKKDEAAVIGSVVQQLQHPKTAPTVQHPSPSKEFKEGARKYSKILEANPQMKTLFSPDVRFSPVNVMYPLETYAVNQWGSSQEAPAANAGASFGMDVKKDRADNAARKAKARSQAAVDKILASGGLTDEDREYLGRVRENPDVLKFSQDQGFKTWLLTRGNDLLQGTPAYRPTWDVR